MSSEFYAPIELEDPTPLQIPATIGKEHFILFEPTAGAVISWRNAITRSARLKDGEMAGWDGLADSEALLVSRCLAYTKKNEAGDYVPMTDPQGKVQFVPESVIRAWKGPHMKLFFNRIKKIGGLDEAPATREDLVKQIEALQKQLKKLDEGKETHLGKESSTDGETPSDKPTN